MITIENDQLTAQINQHGAQMHSLKRRASPVEYLWQGDPQSWNRQAPLLFPFVGRLKDDQYEYQGRHYHQGQHGFARDCDFQVVNQSESAVTFQLTDSKQTLAVYPFHFTLNVNYRLIGNQIEINYQVTNDDSQQSMLYAIGAHPGFRIPLAGDRYEDYQLSLTPAQSYPLSMLIGSYNDIGTGKARTIDFTSPRQLNHELFKDDALTLAINRQPISVLLANPANHHGVKVSAKDIEYLGLWSSYPATGNFVCIEPWWGIADNINASGQLSEKQAIHRLAAGKNANYQFSIQLF